ncbi:hypothetical protein [Planktotalea sp.]|uniref:hypothetical protein n=1 Tax=Planktotalea sp. TaxID=2029877 RepID=UPI0032998DDD
MKIALLHTADVHIATFDELLEAAGFQGTVEHRVRADLLERARGEGIEAVREETLTEIGALAGADAVICTCSTLGSIADEVAHTKSHVFRIDRPVMESACAAGRDIVVAICLESTKEPTLDLLADCAAQLGADVAPRLVLCDAAWPSFESGDMLGFAASIAASIKADIIQHGRPDCIVLAQASMRVAEPRLAGIGVPVMSSPERAARRAIEIASGVN